jgi:hypothetical protein
MSAVMTAIDQWAACAAFVAGSAVSIRARMLRPHQQAWTHAPSPVWFGLSLLGLALLMSAASICFGAHATPREALVYTVLAGVGLVMLWNLNRHGRQRSRAIEVRRGTGPPGHGGQRPAGALSVGAGVMACLLAWGARVSPTFRSKVRLVAADLGVRPDDLMACMAWESGRSFRPDVANMAGSGAVGLIQFMPSTAAAAGRPRRRSWRP